MGIPPKPNYETYTCCPNLSSTLLNSSRRVKLGLWTAEQVRVHTGSPTISEATFWAGNQSNCDESERREDEPAPQPPAWPGQVLKSAEGTRGDALPSRAKRGERVLPANAGSWVGPRSRPAGHTGSRGSPEGPGCSSQGARTGPAPLTSTAAWGLGGARLGLRAGGARAGGGAAAWQATRRTGLHPGSGPPPRGGSGVSPALPTQRADVRRPPRRFASRCHEGARFETHTEEYGWMQTLETRGLLFPTNRLKDTELARAKL
ncbi:uncharacterized protein LOC115518617 [Lynx canadensis]|uniref:uncharacterized protein LOC115518617 n=1 Tax=Lynx canadensis TaxID=61383 RepID=UPI0011B04875|nr:uncharacterized protein LOC115518617 [Lynx canadensis]